MFLRAGNYKSTFFLVLPGLIFDLAVASQNTIAWPITGTKFIDGMTSYAKRVGQICDALSKSALRHLSIAGLK